MITNEQKTKIAFNARFSGSKLNNGLVNSTGNIKAVVVKSTQIVRYLIGPTKIQNTPRSNNIEANFENKV